MLIRMTKNWPSIWAKRRQRDQLPSLHLRNGVVLHHGPYDNPLLLLEEVFVRQLYDFGVRPPANGTMLDIGANIGSVSLFFANQSSTLRIHCYEPNPSAYETLQRNIAGNHMQSRMLTFREGLGRVSGTLNLWVDVPTELSSGYLDDAPNVGGRRIPVPIVSVNDAWQRLNHTPIWLLKVDTEGAEVDILEGAAPEFLAAVKYAIVETHDNIYPGAFKRCRQVLELAGFSCRAHMHPWDEAIIYATRQ
jgi:FkbM family methyltransferase